ncbi:MAG: hypothetical protein A3J07_04910 [Candidatus Doudnabacteria bacterium RIFCSPLOWO2_02_FULL_49_13]|uniref:Reactive intermediate/imine deaminase n=1 Tax=Candidatus Doudnabacteria bacterium RIFCSPHIGHO2_12_FULL_48_16 TaxID=1817838 RepID=A0A1F5PKS5_9BACT|nr:MAG: hypothetical protein A3B77_04550 [Candidatus Doudnabacteria bacterium RIFCSPHIGHO2_02_FULL_49_24]OGE88160.1 MAG: hypothetical protein A2760_02200 [Candidatus Doudnabacteria bacterium RIFCSPHIGHO2_01_FULL_50_67]OGE90469.1 MAG: hypothetical protein A3E29_04980 [Candidatus Doudnabacteria bacterium RIFCSPHIGHO2_12_FULL_48_16]OGE96531.1 MAG: hypothetical protein A2990_03425 [Candidatus Doudnabacteria bacterium RIFCSPLOWO2_01_FULL_49_40]OGF02705.1 MAG: hypothetical protein A3J07_04910 [Candid
MIDYPLSPFQKVGDLVFVSGQIAMKDGELVVGGIREQTAQTIHNIKAVLAQNGLSLKDIVDVAVFLVEQADYNDFNDEYAKFFQEPYPARTTVTVKSLPREAKVEIKVIVKSHETR